MSLKPLNRHLLLAPLEKEEKEKKSTILVPEDYSVVKSRYETYGVLAIAKDCEKIPRDYVGQKALVNNAMVEEMSVEGKTYYLILENHIYGVLE
jgi:co-chaperonin GroES (HSP10)